MEIQRMQKIRSFQNRWLFDAMTNYLFIFGANTITLILIQFLLNETKIFNWIQLSLWQRHKLTSFKIVCLLRNFSCVTLRQLDFVCTRDIFLMCFNIIAGQLICTNNSINPWSEELYPSVDSRFPCISTAITPTGDSVYLEGSILSLAN